jgi:hypothetical protein
MNKQSNLSGRSAKLFERRQSKVNGERWDDAYRWLLSVEQELEASRERYFALYDSVPVRPRCTLVECRMPLAPKSAEPPGD